MTSNAKNTWILILILSLSVIVSIRSAPARTGSDAPFDAFAGEILDGLSATDYTRIPALSGYGAPRVAVWPFKEMSASIPPEIANEFNDRLLAELSRQNAGRFRLVARGTLKTVIAEIDSTSTPGTAGDPVTDLLHNAKVDVLVVGKMRRAGGAVVLGYQAISVEDGGIFASTTPRRLALPSGGAGTLLTLEQAVRDAARQLARHGDDLRGLAVTPLSPGAGDAKDNRFGRYFAGRVSEALIDRLADPIEDRHPRLVEETRASHHLRGTYWDFGDHIEVRLILADGDDNDAVWRERIRSETVIGMLGRAPRPRIEHRQIGPPARWNPPVPPREMVRVRPHRPHRPPPPPSHGPGHRPVVAETQRLLAELGYDPGPPDGIMKPRTRTALAAFQSDAGLPVNGRMTRYVVRRLRREAR